MNNERESVLRRRRTSGNPNLPLNLDVDNQITEGESSQGTPSPGPFRLLNHDGKDHSGPSAALLEFRKKQQSFDIQECLQIEECEEIEIIIESDDEAGGEENITDAAAAGGRPITPTPIQDFAANTVYTEGPQTMDFLKVKTLEQDCITDVSDADSDGEE